MLEGRCKSSEQSDGPSVQSAPVSDKEDEFSLLSSKGTSSDMPWYVVQTKSRQEHVAEENLLRQGYRCYLPRIKIIKFARNRQTIQLDPLFPGYVFFQRAHVEHSIAPVRSTLGVLKVVRFGEEFAVMRPETLASIKQFEAQQHTAQYEELTPIKAGVMVRVASGPLAGLEGLVSSISEKRVVVLFQLLGQDTQVRLSPHQLRLAG